MLYKNSPGGSSKFFNHPFIQQISVRASQPPELFAGPGGCGPALLESLLKHGPQGKPSSGVRRSSSGGSTAPMRQGGTDVCLQAAFSLCSPTVTLRCSPQVLPFHSEFPAQYFGMARLHRSPLSGM